MADAKLQCTVVTPEEILYDAAADGIVVPAHDGEVGFLPGHARFLGKLGLGELRIDTGGATERLFIEGGFVQVAENRVTVLTDRACEPRDIDLAEAHARVDDLRGQGKGEEFADAKHRALVMERVRGARD